MQLLHTDGRIAGHITAEKSRLRGMPITKATHVRDKLWDVEFRTESGNKRAFIICDQGDPRVGNFTALRVMCLSQELYVFSKQ